MWQDTAESFIHVQCVSRDISMLKNLSNTSSGTNVGTQFARKECDATFEVKSRLRTLKTAYFIMINTALWESLISAQPVYSVSVFSVT